MEFDVTVRVKVDTSVFLLSFDSDTREEYVSESVLNALYDCDDLKVLNSSVEEVANEY